MEGRHHEQAAEVPGGGFFEQLGSARPHASFSPAVGAYGLCSLSVGGGTLLGDSSWNTWAIALSRRLRSAHGHTAAWSPKRSMTWPRRGHCVSIGREEMRRRC